MGLLSWAGNRLKEAGEFVNDVADAAMDIPVVREVTLVGQGVVRGVVGGTVGIVDQVGGRVYNLAAGNGFTATNLAEGAKNALTIDRLKPENLTPYERGWLTAGEVTGEAAVLAATFVVGAGAVGAASTIVRGGSAVGRASNWMSKGAKIMNPLDFSSRLNAAGSIVGFGFMAREWREKMVDIAQTQGMEVAEYVQEKYEELDALGGQLAQEYNDPQTTDARKQEIEARAQELNEVQELLERIESGELTVEEREAVQSQIDELLPTDGQLDNPEVFDPNVPSEPDAATQDNGNPQSDAAADAEAQRQRDRQAADDATRAAERATENESNLGADFAGAGNMFENLMNMIGLTFLIGIVKMFMPKGDQSPTQEAFEGATDETLTSDNTVEAGSDAVADLEAQNPANDDNDPAADPALDQTGQPEVEVLTA